MEVAQMLKSLKTWHCFQEGNEEINKTALKSAILVLRTENATHTTWNNQWLSSWACLSQGGGLTSHWSTIIHLPPSSFIPGVAPKMSMSWYTLVLYVLALYHCGDLPYTYFHTCGGYVLFTMFLRAWMLAIKGKHLSQGMDTEGPGEDQLHPAEAFPNLASFSGN